jgi:hypothetical protein
MRGFGFALLGFAAVVSMLGCAASGPEPPVAALARVEEAPPDRTQAPTLAAADPAFRFPSDLGGKQLQERLTPPVQAPVPPVPFVSEPRPRPTPPVERRGDRVLPPPDLSAPAHVLPSDLAKHERARPVVDQPSLPADLRLRVPREIEFPLSLKAYVASPPPDAPPPLTVLARAFVAPVTAGSDSTSEAARQTLLQTQSPLRDQPVAPLVLAIPDPLQNARDVKLQTPPAEVDEPAFVTSRPPLPPFPAK